jgi:hypothetical protein
MFTTNEGNSNGSRNHFSKMEISKYPCDDVKESYILSLSLLFFFGGQGQGAGRKKNKGTPKKIP